MNPSEFWSVFWSVVFIVVVSILSLLQAHWPRRDRVELPEDEQDEGHRPEYQEALQAGKKKSSFPG